MPRTANHHHHREQSLRVWAMVTVLLMVVPSVATAQKKSRSGRGLKTVSGKIISIEEKGRTRVLTVEDEEGKMHEQILTARTPVTVQGQGDAGFFRVNAVVSTQALLTKKELFGKKFTVQLKGSARPSVKQGKSKEVYELTGSILKVMPEYLLLNLGRSGRKKVNLEPGYEVTVVTRDTDLIAVGATIEMKGTPSRGRLKLRSVDVTLAEPLDSATYFESRKKSKTRKGRRSKASERRKPAAKKGLDGEKNKFDDTDGKN